MLRLIQINIFSLLILSSLALNAEDGARFVPDRSLIIPKSKKIEVLVKQTPDKTEFQFQFSDKIKTYTPETNMSYSTPKDNSVAKGNKKVYYITKWRSGMRAQEVIVFDPTDDKLVAFRASSYGEIDYEIKNKKLTVYIVDEDGERKTETWKLD